jgi:hypothetical protein
VWARTERYKARFGPDGASFIPFLGSRAPRNFPLTLSLESITGGGQPFLSAAPAAPVRRGDAVVYDRGAVVERYDLRPDSMEQSFVLSALPAPGDLVVRMRIESEMEAVPAGPGAVEYVAPGGWGRVGVSEAVAFDAAGRQAPLEIAHEPGVLELRVPASFLAGAALPLTIDPVFRSFPVSEVPTQDDFSVDTASRGDLWLVCFERAYSATDHDVWAEVHYSQGPAPGSGVYIDVTTSYWSGPRAAHSPWSDQYLVVATVGPPTANNRAVWGRTRNVTPTQGNQIQIAGGRADDRAWDPDVGGDLISDEANRFLVVFTQAGSDGRSQVVAWPRNAHGESGGLPITMGGSSLSAHSPAVSSTAGRAPASSACWNVVWVENTTFGYRVRALQLDRAQNTVTPEFTVVAGLGLTNPVVSPINNDPGNGQRPYLVVWEDYVQPGGFATELLGAVYHGSTRLASANLSEIGSPYRVEDQVEPSVDGDGCRFVLAYSESYQGSATDYDVFATTLLYDAGAIAVSERHVPLDTSTTREERPSVAAGGDGNNGSRYVVVWDSRITATNHDVRGALYDGHNRAGGHVNVPSGCGGPVLTTGGKPALGGWVEYLMTGGTGVPYLFVGAPMPPLTLCGPCTLGVFPGTATILPGLSRLSVSIPCQPALLGQSVALQGASVGMPGGCPSPLTFALSNTIVTTVQ